MASLEERVTELEKAMATQQKEFAALPNQDGRITNLEQRTARAIQKERENTTIMLGVMRSQGQDIQKIFEQLEAMGERSGRLETKIDEHTRILYDHTSLLNDHTKILNDHTKTLDDHTKILNDHTKTLDDHTKTLDDHTKILNDHTSLLTQILERLPEKNG